MYPCVSLFMLFQKTFWLWLIPVELMFNMCHTWTVILMSMMTKFENLIDQKTLECVFLKTTTISFVLFRFEPRWVIRTPEYAP